jgi:hypothetical protein
MRREERADPGRIDVVEAHDICQIERERYEHGIERRAFEELDGIRGPESPRVFPIRFRFGHSC